MQGYEKIEKAWGHEEIYINNEHYCMKRLIVNVNHQCSLHRHLKKHETFLVEMGTGIIEVGDERFIAHPGGIIAIPPGTWHRFANFGRDVLVLREISTHHDDTDVERQFPSGKIPFLPAGTLSE